MAWLEVEAFEEKVKEIMNPASMLLDEHKGKTVTLSTAVAVGLLGWWGAENVVLTDDLNAAVIDVAASKGHIHPEYQDQIDTMRDDIFDLIANTESIGDQIRGYIEVGQRIRDLLRAQCMGAGNLAAQLSEAKTLYSQLTGSEYNAGLDPTCAELNAA